eukprot:5368423-Amphidinium_carterae.1
MSQALERVMLAAQLLLTTATLATLATTTSALTTCRLLAVPQWPQHTHRSVERTAKTIRCRVTWNRSNAPVAINSTQFQWLGHVVINALPVNPTLFHGST